MPLYAYRCKNCGYEFEERQRMMDDPLTVCPNCEQAELRRVIDRVGVVFRGSGFYVTDNKGNNPAAPSTDKAVDKKDNTAEGATEKVAASKNGSSASKATEKAAVGES